jgi:hypothetical protein
MAFNWEPYYRKILALSEQGNLSQSEIAAKLTEETGVEITRDMVRHALARAEEIVAKLADYTKPIRTPYIDKYAEYIYGKKAPEPKQIYKRREILSKKNAKALVAADLHIPFHDEAKFEEMVRKHIDADVFLGVADFLDCYSQSVFDKNLDIPLVFELDEALRIIEYISDNFDYVELLSANHEFRIRRAIERRLPPELQFLAETSILKVLCAPFPNVVVHDQMWFYQFGTAILTHPEKASRVELKAAINVYEHFAEWKEHYGLAPYNTIIVAHTHGMGVSYTSTVKVVETGCLAKAQGYAYSPKIPYKRPSRNGYSVLELHEGTVDWNESREYSWPLEVM